MQQQTNNTTNPKLEQALTALKLGWSIIPVGKNKKPLIEWKKYQTEKPIEEEVKNWFDKFPHTNIAVVTGAISNLVIIDIDPRHGGSEEAFKDVITPESRTGGGGMHVFFKFEEGIENKAGIQEGIDVRGEGGYAVLPPSDHESGNKYEWILNPSDTPLAPLPDFVKGWIGSSGIRNESKTAEVINGVPEGQRNNSAASVAGKLLVKYPQGEWETEVWPLLQGWNSKNSPPLPEDELRSVFESIIDKELKKPEVPNGKLKVKTKKSSEKQEKSDNESEELHTSFYVTGDNRVCEEVLDPEPLFAVFDGKSVSYQSIIKDKDQIVKPSAEQFIVSGKVKLPSKATEYGSELDLFNEIKEFVHSYVDISPEWEEWASHYVLLSWVYDKLPVCPYLCALGPSDCGKTRFVQTVGNLCYKPIVASGSITASPLFRLLDRFHGTLVINEFDHVGNYDDEIIVILNNGFEAGLPVWRTEGDREKIVRSFDVFGPKLFATRRRKNDWAFESRLLTVPMRITKRRDIPPFLLEDFYQGAANLRNKLLMFRFKHYGQEVKFRTDLFTGISGRLRQTLLSITAVIKDEGFLAQAEEFATKLQKELKAMKGFDLDGTIYQVLTECWENGDKQPLLKDVTKKVKELADMEKLAPKTVGNIVRDELGFRTTRFGHSGNYVVLLNEEQLANLKERYDEGNETSSATSASSAQSQAPAEDAELAELGPEDLKSLEEKIIKTLAEFTTKKGFVQSYYIAEKVGCPYLWVKQTLERLSTEGKVLRYGKDKDSWAVNYQTREQLGFTGGGTPPQA